MKIQLGDLVIQKSEASNPSRTTWLVTEEKYDTNGTRLYMRLDPLGCPRGPLIISGFYGTGQTLALISIGKK